MESIRAKKSLGQNFLRDSRYLEQIAHAAGLLPSDQVLEIGPGLGHLTAVLAARARHVLALELDDRLIPHLRNDFPDGGRVRIMHADAMQFPFDTLEGRWKVVANLPYYISTPIIQTLIRHRARFESLTLMLQKEVAERIAASPGGKEYGYLSVLVQLYAAARINFFVPPTAFTPQPDVESAVVTLTILPEPACPIPDEQYLLQLVKTAFSQRRKTLRNTLKPLGLPKDVMEAIFIRSGMDPARRPETLSVAEFGILAEYFRAAREGV